MKTITLAFCLAVFAYGGTLANESRHSVIVDMPAVATLSHASPDTWDTLPPIQQERRPLTFAHYDFAPRRGLGTELTLRLSVLHSYVSVRETPAETRCDAHTEDTQGR